MPSGAGTVLLKIKEWADMEKILLDRGVFPEHVCARLSDYKRLPAERPAYIYGHVGSGKTHLSVAYLVAYLLDTYAQVLALRQDAELDIRNILRDRVIAGAGFVRAVDLIMRVRSSFKDSGPEEIIDRSCRYKFWVLDDLGTERETPLVQEVLYSILDYRAGHQLPTLIASNFSLDHITGHYGDYGERIASRIAGMGPSSEMKGEDRRWEK